MGKKSIFVFVFFGVIAFIIAIVLGSGLTYTTGIPLVGGLINGVLTGAILTVGLLSRRYFLGATIMWIAFSLCATATTTLGPPGLYKIFIGLIAGIIWDFFYSWCGKYKKWGLYVGGMAGSASIMISMIIFLRLGFGDSVSNAIDKYEKQFVFLVVMNMIITLVGLFFGTQLYEKRLKNLSQFKNLHN